MLQLCLPVLMLSIPWKLSSGVSKTLELPWEVLIPLCIPLKFNPKKVSLVSEQGALQYCPHEQVDQRQKDQITDYYIPDKKRGGFSGGTVVKNPPANAGDTGLNPGPGRSHMLWSN